MERFTRVPEGLALVRHKGGLLKELPLYKRAGKLYIPMRGGYLPVLSQMGDRWLTSDTNVSVLEMTGV